MSLVILFFLLIYVAVLVGMTAFGYRWGKSQGWSLSECRWAATVGFLVIFLPMFGDWLPTIWLHSYYCEKQAGVTVSKTPEQWRHENPGVAETLVRPKSVLQVGAGEKYFFQLNQRIRWEIALEDKPLWLKQDKERLMDAKTGEVLAQFVDFSTGQSGSRLDGFRDIKAWMYRDSCDPQGQYVTRKKFNQIEAGFAALGEKR